MEAPRVPSQNGEKGKKFLLNVPLYVQVLVGIVLGIVFGSLLPEAAQNPWVEAMGKAFVKLVKMAIAPIIFCTVVSGISHVADAATVGRVALKAIVYFEVISTFALGLGLLAGNLVKPGDGFNSSPNAEAVKKYEGKEKSGLDMVMHIIPATPTSAFAEGDTLQILFFSVLFGFAIQKQGEHVHQLRDLIGELARVMFGVVNIIMHFAPLAAFGAMSFTIGKYGIGTLGNLLKLVLTMYATAACFVVFVLGIVALLARVNIFRLILYIKEELLLVLATSSSECALPQLMEKLEDLGIAKPVVGLVVPLGYSFNLDGTNIYMTLATVFVAQAMGHHLTLVEQLKCLLVAMLTSKGAAAVTGGGFIVLAATLSSIHPELVPGMAVLLGIDKFMSECRSITNFLGNSVATVVVATSEGALNRERMDSVLQSGFAPKETWSEDHDRTGSSEV